MYQCNGHVRYNTVSHISACPQLAYIGNAKQSTTYPPERCAYAGELWTSADMVDCIVAYAASALVDKMTDPRNQEGREMLEAVKADARASKQFLLLAHL